MCGWRDLDRYVNALDCPNIAEKSDKVVGHLSCRQQSEDFTMYRKRGRDRIVPVFPFTILSVARRSWQCVSITGPASLAEQIGPDHGCSLLFLVPLLQPDTSVPLCSMPSGNYTCNIMSFNFKRHNNTYKFLQRHNYVLQNCMTFLCHKF